MNIKSLKAPHQLNWLMTRIMHLLSMLKSIKIHQILMVPRKRKSIRARNPKCQPQQQKNKMIQLCTFKRATVEAKLI